MLSLGRILILDLVADLFMLSLPGMILLYLAALFYTVGVFVRDIITFVNNNCYKQQSNTSGWEHPRESTQHTAVEQFVINYWTH